MEGQLPRLSALARLEVVRRVEVPAQAVQRTLLTNTALVLGAHEPLFLLFLVAGEAKPKRAGTAAAFMRTASRPALILFRLRADWLKPFHV